MIKTPTSILSDEAENHGRKKHQDSKATSLKSEKSDVKLVVAQAKFLRISPKKVRLVANAVKGVKTEDALIRLQYLNKKAAVFVRKLLLSAIANAENNFHLNKDNLYIKNVRVNAGPTLNRFMPKAHGRAAPIRKRTTHLIMELHLLGETKKARGLLKKKPIISAKKSIV